QGRLAHRKRGDPEQCCSQERRTDDAAGESLDRLGGRELRGEQPFPAKLAPYVLQYVTRLHDEYEEYDQKRLPTLVTWNIQGQERRHVRDAKDRDHQSPLSGRTSLHEVL